MCESDVLHSWYSSRMWLLWSGSDPRGPDSRAQLLTRSGVTRDHAGPQQGERGVRLHQVQVATHRQEVRAQDVWRLPGPLRGGVEDTGSVCCKTTLSYWHSVILSVSTIWCQEPSVVPLDVPAAPVRPAQRGDVGVSRQGAWQRGGGDYERYISTLSHSTRDQDNRDLTRKVRTQVQWCLGLSQITPQPGKYFSKGLFEYYIMHQALPLV